MSRHHPFRAIPWLAAFFAVFLTSAINKSPAAGNNKPLIRIVCVSSVTENQEVVLAARDIRGETWQELGTVELRASMISDWLPAQAGELHLAVREGGALKSICQFAHPADASRGLVLLIADHEKQTYNAHFVEPDKTEFLKGTFLVSNLSTQTASVFLGPNEEKIEAGQHVVVKPTLEENGMFRMQVTRPGKDDQPEACYDRYTSDSPDSRGLLFLLPDEKSGLKVMSIPLFSDLD